MKVSLNWVKEFTDVKLPVEKLVEIIGAQLGEVETVVDIGKRYRGIVIAKVVTCQRHPNADKLHICSIDDGRVAKHVKRDSKGHIQVVCGAPNVHSGQLVAWLPPGTVVPATIDKEPLVLESREIRGEISNGMLASASELGLGEDHSGILELNPHDAKPGDDFAKTYKLDDFIIDIENKMFTHRPDLFGILGVAREIAGIQNLAFKSPDWYQKSSSYKGEKAKLTIHVKVEDHKLVPRFMATPMTITHNGQSIPWLITYLSRVGIRPINSVVDITNYAMYLTAQPLHAYDYDKVRALSSGNSAELVARKAKKGETLKLLGGKEIKLSDTDIVIATSKQVIGLAGIMGGADTEVDETTKNIILECANFNMYSIRKSSMEHGLFTDAVTRFNKGQSAFQNNQVLNMTIGHIHQLLSGEVAGPIHDIKKGLKEPPLVSVTPEFVNERLGSKLSIAEMTKLLENVEFKIISVPANKKHLHIQAPFWRTDIEIPEDIVEEIGRLYGYDKLPLKLPMRSIEPSKRNKLLDFKDRLRRELCKAGANELLTYTFTHSDLLEKVGQKPKQAYQLSNASSPELQYYRLSLIPSLLEKVRPNVKQGYGEMALFEINPVHAKGFVDKNDLPIEDQRLALVFAADDKTVQAKYSGAPYYAASSYLTTLLTNLGIQPVFHTTTDHRPELPISQAAIAPFDTSRAAIVKSIDGDFIGEIGEFTPAVQRNLKLPQFAAGFELDVLQLLKLASPKPSYTQLSRYPRVTQDVTLRVPTNMPYSLLQEFLMKNRSAPTISEIQFAPIDIYKDAKDKKNKHITLRYTITSYERTQTSGEINALLDKIAAAAKEELGAERI